MPSYSLNIKFRQEDLPTLYKAGEKVVVVKHTEGSSDSQVAWVSFCPFKLNTVSWSTSFALYASKSDIMNGVSISKVSDISASPKTLYKFRDGIFMEPEASSMIGNNTFALRNEMPGYASLTFGLAQDVVVNDDAFPNSPINAVCVPFGQGATMTPIERVDVYLSNDIIEATVISHVMSERLQVSYIESEDSHTIEYNGSTGQFIQTK